MRRRRIPAVIAVLAVVAGLIAMSPPQPAEAASASDFSPGNLISDANFFDGTAMSSTQVQALIAQKNPGCASGSTCLVTYSQSTPSIPADAYCRAYQGSSRETAASIIARVGQACNVSQRALLVLLEKEQSLVTSRAPSSSQYTKATGFGCPDTAPCDASVGGFFYQVYYGARQFQRYAAHPENYNHRAGVVNRILYHPNAACGSSPVLIENQATAGLYNYTPYQPNAAAMRNLYGSGDTCSAYGNRNFWRLFTDWFGDPRGVGSGPSVGQIDASVSTSGLSGTVSGWAFDPDTSDSIRVHLYADGYYGTGRFIIALTADQARSDIGRRTPGGGNLFGFRATVDLPTGTGQVCAHAIDATGHGNTMIGCARTSPIAGSPIGNFDSGTAAAANGTLNGWAHDPDTRSPIEMHVYQGGPYGSGRHVGSFTADRPRADVQRAVATAGAAHGFAIPVALPATGDRFCAYGINVAGGQNRLLGCRDIAPQSGPPRGTFESASAAPGAIEVRGWALDPDVITPVRVQVRVDGVLRTTLNADRDRADIGRAFPGYGDAHGFVGSVPAAAGSHSVCVTVVNVGKGADRNLGCRTAEALGGPPRGNFEAIRTGSDIGSVSLVGWALDPDTAAAIRVRVSVDGRDAGVFAADASRPDVARTFPAHGPLHGFQIPLQLGAGSHRVCVTALDSLGGDASRSLGCRTATVTGGAPRGNFESAALIDGSATLRGWALDPDTAASITIRVTVNGADSGTHLAAAHRPDVARHYPAHGAAHGFELRVPVSDGRLNTVCVTAIDARGGQPPTSLGCRTVDATTSSPRGVFDGATVEGSSAVIHGWAFDPDTTEDVRVRVEVNGSVATELLASQPRPDVDRAIAEADATTGFRGPVAIPSGTSRICVTALDASGGDADRLLGCRSVTR